MLYLTILGISVSMLPMLKIRLQRVGRKAEPTFRLVLTDSKNSTKSGKYIENLGNYDSRRGEKAAFKVERINYWLSRGAQASGTVHNLFVENKIVTGKKVNVLPLKKAIVKDAPVENSAPSSAEEVATEAPKEEVTPKEEAQTEEPKAE